MSEVEIKDGDDNIVPSSFTSHLISAEISENAYNFRILKMENSVFIYIGESSNEVFDEMGVAMPMPTGEIVKTSIMGPILGNDSQELAQKISIRLKKQVYISCNVPTDRLVRPFLEKKLIEEINAHPDWF